MPKRSSLQTQPATHQPITPELRAWLIEQAQAGFSGPVVFQSMLDAGWDASVAAYAMGQVLGDALKPGAAAPRPAAAPSTAAAVADRAATAGSAAEPALPGPDLARSPARIDVGDRQVDVLMRMAEPRIVLFGNLLSPEECDALIAAAEPRMARSLTVATRTGGEEVNDDRTSDGMFFQRGENDVVTRLEARIARLLNWPVENGEGLQVLHYRPGAEYKPHYDYFDPAEPGTPTILRRGGQRLATLVIYLNDPERGGGTTFPDVHLEVSPRRGNAVFFSYARPQPDTRTLHGGAPVEAGEKWIATKWLREREFH
ncbi:2OG-Fe(II) oxygenase [Acidovorax sp. Leaf160]|uniref:2OG-Fe(II) oxygenase n=1 Tax=Acidovorax sp. Leaf160 TaxID=1736280 RepID=UPI0006FA3550|nr:2OG-Fe(II) oxygenase [Acidovorax sp. Leaf160]KQR45011.1 proline dioxygenase [Acidovorax sp. Leaf160]